MSVDGQSEVNCSELCIWRSSANVVIVSRCLPVVDEAESDYFDYHFNSEYSRENLHVFLWVCVFIILGMYV